MHYDEDEQEIREGNELVIDILIEKLLKKSQILEVAAGVEGELDEIVSTLRGLKKWETSMNKAFKELNQRVTQLENK